MTTEVLEREKPAAKAPATRKVIEEAPPRVYDVIKVIIRTIQGFHGASRQELQKAAKKNGYSESELNAALKWLAETTVDVRAAAPTEKAPVQPSAPGSESNLKTFDPYAAGERLVKELQAAEGGAWTGAELLARFGLTSAVLHRRRKESRILCWRDAQHEFHYPQWQFTATGALLPGMQEVLQTFRSADEWRLMSYFLGKRQQLGGRRPLDLLRTDETGKLLEHARIHAKENTW